MVAGEGTATVTSPAQESVATTSSTAPAIDGELGLARPAWLGTRVLPLRPDGFGEVTSTPAELVDRRIPTIDLLPPPTGDAFRASSGPVPADVVARSTWSPDCPVTLDDLASLTVSFWGFDGRHHTGELVVNVAVADDILLVFEELHRARFPIEEMRVVSLEELEAPPTGDGNNTTSFVCRPTTLRDGWSQHAYGLAIDINPFHNPYEKGDLVVPELASAYTDRTDIRPGMILENDDTNAAMEQIGWGWGGAWTTLTDPMHFSQNGH